MTKRTVQHEIKLEKSVKIILGALAIGVMANAFTPDMGIKDAMAELYDGSSIYIHHSGQVRVK
tara:strand:- start:66 stop:254 length:189 start_codon:yes stop_codon:yes gene_type:complete